MLGVLVNFAAIIVGAIVGILFKRGMSERLSKSITTAVALAVVYIGIDGMLSGENTLVLVLSMVIGSLIGTLLDLDARLEKLGNWLESKFSNKAEKGTIAKGFISASLLFCVGAMAIVGSLQSGLLGNHEMLFAKSILDFVSSVVLASALGMGVVFSAFPVLILQGLVAILARFVAPFLSEYVVNEMTCAGSVLILALGLNLLGITKIKMMNYVPAIFLPILLCMFM